MKRRGFLAALLAVAAAPKRAIAEALERHRKEAERKRVFEQYFKEQIARSVERIGRHHAQMFYGDAPLRLEYSRRVPPDHAYLVYTHHHVDHRFTLIADKSAVERMKLTK